MKRLLIVMLSLICHFVMTAQAPSVTFTLQKNVLDEYEVYANATSSVANVSIQASSQVIILAPAGTTSSLALINGFGPGGNPANIVNGTTNNGLDIVAIPLTAVTGQNFTSGVPFPLFKFTLSGCTTGDVRLFTSPGDPETPPAGNWLNSFSLFSVVFGPPFLFETYTGSDITPESCGLVPTPVELLSFDAYAQGKKARLEWATSLELNNSGFEVQRSTDGKEWEVLGWVDGHGNSSVDRAYSLIDKAPFMGTNYYRLKQVDYDGAFEYSDVRSASFSFTSEVATIYPNPAMDYMNISFPADLRGELYMEVLDANRTIVYDEIIDVTRGMVKTFDTNDLPSGMYTLKLFARGYEEYLPFIIARP